LKFHPKNRPNRIPSKVKKIDNSFSLVNNRPHPSTSPTAFHVGFSVPFGHSNACFFGDFKMKNNWSRRMGRNDESFLSRN
jgi:hypothetical protein